MMNKPFEASVKKKALLIGDSHAQDFLNSVLENGILVNYQISTRYIPAQCQIYLGDAAKAARYIAPKDKTLCKKSDSLAKAKQQIAEADVVILAAFWREWAAKALPQTIKNLNLSAQQKLFVIGRKSFGKVAIRKYLRMPEDKLRNLRNKVDGKQTAINHLMQTTLDSDVFVNVQKLVCGDSESCPVFTNDMKLISFDGGHLTKDGARYMGKLLFQGSPLNVL